MFNTKAASIIALLAGAACVRAHGHVVSWTIGGKEMPGYDPSNPGRYGASAERPTDNNDQGYADYNSPIVACGSVKAGSGVLTVDVDAGSTITAHWDQWPSEHLGPVTEYMARCPDSGCDGVDAARLDWFKIAEANWDGTEWPTAKVARDREWSFTVPSDLAAGEIPNLYLTLQAVSHPPQPARHAQYRCSPGLPSVLAGKLRSSGSAVPSDTVKFPAAYNLNDGFKSLNIYTGDVNSFVPPGPAVYSGGSSTGDGGAGAGAGAGPTTDPAPSPSPSTDASTVPAPSTSASDTYAAVPAPAPTKTEAANANPAPTVAPTVAPAPVPTRKCNRRNKRRALSFQ